MNPSPLLNVHRDEKTGRYILYIDASLYKTTACMKRVYYSLFRGLRSMGGTWKMDYGTAAHKALQTWLCGGTLEKGLQAATEYYNTVEVPDTDWRHVGHLVNLLVQYHHVYGNGDNLLVDKSPSGVCQVEQKFAWPFYQTPEVEVLLCGTIDMKGRYIGQPVIVDHKTHAPFNPRGIDSYLRSYSLSPQLMIYRLIHSKLFPEEEMGCMINGLFLNKAGKNTFRRSEIFHFSPLKLETLERHLMQITKAIVGEFLQHLHDPTYEFQKNYTACEEKFGMCAFHSLCQLDSLEDVESVIPNEFQVKHYNPLQFQT